MDSPAVRGGVACPVPGIKSIVTGHFEIPFGDMLYQELDEVDGRDGLLHKYIVFVPVVMERDVFTVIGVNAGKSNDRSSQVAADISDDGIRIGKGRFGIDIKPVLVFAIDKRFGLFKRGSDFFLHFVQEDSLESPAQIGIIEMFYRAPETLVRETAFGNEAVYMGVPFQRASESMEDTDKARDKVIGHVELMEHM